MNELGNKIAKKRKDLGLTQAEFAEELMVTRQTVSRWEAGTVMPDIDKIGDIASYLGVSCDYLLKDGITDEGTVTVRNVGKILSNMKGKTVKLNFFDGEADIDLYDTACKVLDFEGSWMKVSAEIKHKGHQEKLIPLASVSSMEICEEEA